MRTHTMTFGKVKKTVAEWNARLDKLVYPKLFENIVSELKVAGYDPPNAEQRLAVCQGRCDKITPFTRRRLSSEAHD